MRQGIQESGIICSVHAYFRGGGPRNPKAQVGPPNIVHLKRRSFTQPLWSSRARRRQNFLHTSSRKSPKKNQKTLVGSGFLSVCCCCCYCCCSSTPISLAALKYSSYPKSLVQEKTYSRKKNSYPLTAVSARVDIYCKMINTMKLL